MTLSSDVSMEASQSALVVSYHLLGRKDAITPVSKSSSVARDDELRHIALTSTLSKLLEDFVKH